MNYKQYLLFKLAEEASEISQAAIKCALFGEKSKDPRENNGKTNLEKLLLEMLDLASVTDLMQEEFQNNIIDLEDEDTYVSNKRTKLKYYWEVVQKNQGETNV